MTSTGLLREALVAFDWLLLSQYSVNSWCSLQ